MKKNIILFSLLLFTTVLFQVKTYASCHSDYRGVYQDKNVELKIRFSTSSGPTRNGFFSNRSLNFKLKSKNKDIQRGKVVINNVLFYIKNTGRNSYRDEIRVSLYASQSEYKVLFIYEIPNPDKNAPRWKQKIKIIKKLLVIREKAGSCHYQGKLKVRELK